MNCFHVAKYSTIELMDRGCRIRGWDAGVKKLIIPMGNLSIEDLFMQGWGAYVHSWYYRWLVVNKVGV